MALSAEHIETLKSEMAPYFGNPVETGNISEDCDGCYYVNFRVSGEGKDRLADVWFDRHTGELDWCF